MTHQMPVCFRKNSCQLSGIDRVNVSIMASSLKGICLLFRPMVKCRLRTSGPDLRTGKWLGLVLGFMLRARLRVRVSIGVKIKVRVSSSILSYCRSAGSVRRSTVRI